MTALTLAILCFAGGVILLIAEILLPSHGILGIVGAGALITGVGACFAINQYAGLASAIGVVILMPVAVAAWVKVWPHTYAGKRLILGPTSIAAAHVPARNLTVGQVGTVVSELRPGGVCEFPGAERVESRCENGTIPAGRRVEVIAVVDGRPLVRAV
jgi:membrane-bound serine protease (ClpP class)